MEKMDRAHRGDSQNAFEQLMISFLFVAVPLGISFWTISGMLDQYSEVRWFLIYSVSLLLVLGSFLSRIKIRVPDFQCHRWVRFGLVGAAASSLVAVAISFPGNIEIQVLEWICFGVLLIWSHTLASSESGGQMLLRSIRFANGIGILGVGGYLIAQQTGHAWSYLAVHPGQTASLFGNKNFAASYFAIATLIHLSGFERGGRGSLVREIVKWLLLLLGGYGLATMKARGATLGFISGVLLLGFARVKLSRKAKWSIASVVMASVVFVAVFFSYRGIEDSANTRSIRLARWANTLAMIGEHPLGVGSGRYEFDYIPYASRYQVDPEITETNTSKSPHNLPLQIAAEHGLVTMILLTVILCWILFRAWSFHPGVVAILVSILVDGFFAFPFQVPYSFFVFAVFLGVSMGRTFPSLEWRPTRIFSMIRVGVVAVIAWVTFLCVSSVMAESHDMNDYGLMKRACEHAPWRLKNCLSYAVILGNQKRFEEGAEVARRVLARQPNLFPMYYVLSELNRLSGDKNGFCDAIAKYDAIFGGRSSIHSEWRANCRGE
jgi:hypothetical protein